MSKEIDASRSQPSADGGPSPLAHNARIWLVTGMTGEYSDRSEWPTRAFHTQTEAQAYVDFLTIEREKLPARTYDWEANRKIEAAMRVFDPGFSEAYTGTAWHVSELSLAPAASGRDQ